ncbi:hypothetical protein K788_0007059 (plasmid) [Paraburkholderia caribensis MBA4]|uniref:Uncharacterized protein n=1 Tax=Paraburkholderia caribensis MBA4 TaxID=1323664 RepID=A0A0P0RRL8_9BURK|nr:hypothetical protein K788_0007059 [Paraburkholderia caribensis MBA4]
MERFCKKARVLVHVVTPGKIVKHVVRDGNNRLMPGGML